MSLIERRYRSRALNEAHCARIDLQPAFLIANGESSGEKNSNLLDKVYFLNNEFGAVISAKRN